MSLQKKRFGIAPDASKLFTNRKFQPDKPVEVLKKEKLDFFLTKVFCEDLSSPYHYVHFHKNKSKEFPDEPPNDFIMFRDYYYNTSKEAYCQCLFEYKLKKKVKEIEQTLL